jgi:hypothetical protein
MRNLTKPIALAIALSLGLSACGVSRDTEPRSISEDQVAAMKAEPKYQSAGIAGDLNYIVNWGKDAASPSQRILGKIIDVLPPRRGQLGSSGFELLWIPVVLEVEQADPELSSERVIVRIIPRSEFTQNLDEVNIGDRVLTVGTAMAKDPSGETGSSLGWMLEVATDGGLRDLNTANQISGTFNEVADLLRMKPLN